ncbi:hypothetical protein [Paenibacillus sp. Cedars]|uniref:hypothetical protein n=1 Tax=Paenibacillus sp. Cedars TaxID=1980674 RepID=UPI001165A227|nr:hypothetical protein [Paenibacillus sp. Cedars]AWP28797.1 hypothetical protein B9D94_20190 [Paenibacillus sp. Cedars]
MNREELSVYCLLVKRGKPAAVIPLQERYLEEAMKIVESTEGLLTHADRLSEGWISFWVYQYPHILEVIKNAPQAPKTAYDHWLLGKLFGYDERTIQEVIKTSLI